MTVQTSAAIRRGFFMFPRGKSGGKWMYALGFADGRTKIGVTQRPFERMSDYWRQSGGAVVWAHVFKQVSEAPWYVPERRAIALISQQCTRHGRSEYFTGISRDDVIRLCRLALNQENQAAA